jgi:hypothetical protein
MKFIRLCCDFHLLMGRDPFSSSRLVRSKASGRKRRLRTVLLRTGSRKSQAAEKLRDL